MTALQFGSVIRVASVQRNDRKTNRDQEFATTKMARQATWDLGAVLKDPLGPFIEPNDELKREMEAVRDEFKAKDPDYQGTKNHILVDGDRYADVQYFRFRNEMYLVTGEDVRPLAEVHSALKKLRESLFANRKTNGLVYDNTRQTYKYLASPQYKGLMAQQRDVMSELAAKATKTLSMRVFDNQRQWQQLPNYRVQQLEITG